MKIPVKKREEEKEKEQILKFVQNTLE